jgi:sugar/nucleoside kinase (ribokinase family)
MYDLISIGSVTIDLYFKGQSLTKKDDRFYLAIGGKYVIDYFYESLGGGGANVAIGASHFGLNTAVLAKVGENVFKQIIIQKLIKKGVSTEFLISEEDYFNISSILLTESGERTIIHYLTPHKSFDLSEIMKQNLTKTRLVYLGSLPDVSISERKELLELFKKNKIITCLNLGVTDCRRPLTEVMPLINFSDILIINTHEFAELIKKPYQEIDFKGKNLINHVSTIKLNKKILVLTDGEKGSYLYFNNQFYYQKAIKPKKIVDTTGAGDAYTSGFLSSYLADTNLEKAMRVGAEYATKILEKIGAN